MPSEAKYFSRCTVQSNAGCDLLELVSRIVIAWFSCNEKKIAPNSQNSAFFEHALVVGWLRSSFCIYARMGCAFFSFHQFLMLYCGFVCFQTAIIFSFLYGLSDIVVSIRSHFQNIFSFLSTPTQCVYSWPQRSLFFRIIFVDFQKYCVWSSLQSLACFPGQVLQQGAGGAQKHAATRTKMFFWHNSTQNSVWDVKFVFL